MGKNQDNETNVTKSVTKKGAPFGNKNAVGHGAPMGNQNAVGNSGGAPYMNKNAVRHGLFSSHTCFIPPTPENCKVFDWMEENGIPLIAENFNACKKLMKKLKS